MSGYRLTGPAIDDLGAILSNVAEREGWDRAMTVELELFDAFERLASNPGIGHLRADLTALPLFFLAADPHMIIHDRDCDPLRIVAIIHSSRNVRRLPRQRARRP